MVEYSSQWSSMPRVEVVGGSHDSESMSDGTYRPPASASTSLFASMGDKLRSYGSISGDTIGYRSLHAVPEVSDPIDIEWM